MAKVCNSRNGQLYLCPGSRGKKIKSQGNLWLLSEFSAWLFYNGSLSKYQNKERHIRREGTEEEEEKSFADFSWCSRCLWWFSGCYLCVSHYMPYVGSDVGCTQCVLQNLVMYWRESHRRWLYSKNLYASGTQNLKIFTNVQPKILLEWKYLRPYLKNKNL